MNGTNEFNLGDQQPFTYTNIYGSNFGDAPDSSLPKRHREILEE